MIHAPDITTEKSNVLPYVVQMCSHKVISEALGGCAEQWCMQIRVTMIQVIVGGHRTEKNNFRAPLKSWAFKGY